MSPQSIALDVREALAGSTLDMETRFEAVADTGDVEGWAVRFGVVDTFRTSFDQRAFTTSPGESIPLLWAHDPAQVVGSVREVRAEPDGLRIKGRLNLSVSKAQEVRALLQAGDIKGLSIGFQRLRDEVRAGGVRHITSARLREVSFVAIPSVPGSNVTHVRASTGRESAAAFVSACREAARAFRKA